MKALIPFLVILCTACHNEDPSVNDSPVPAKIFITPGMFKGDGYVNAGLMCRTDNAFIAGYLDIKRSIEKTSTGYIIRFEGIQQGIADTGWPAEPYATCNVNFDGITNGTYTIELINGNFKSVGQLIIADNGITVSVTGPQEIEILPSIFQDSGSN